MSLISSNISKVDALVICFLNVRGLSKDKEQKILCKKCTVQKKSKNYG